MEKALFAAGCFWGVQFEFDKIEGVTKSEVGYAGGNTEYPTYKDVCTGTTNHAEVVYLEFDPNIVSFETLLKTFWSLHNPTTLNRQGPDIGTQYRSAVFTFDESQQTEAEKIKAELNKSQFDGNIVTEITPYTNYYAAEDYHQKYVAKRDGKSSCNLNY